MDYIFPDKKLIDSTLNPLSKDTLESTQKKQSIRRYMTGLQLQIIIQAINVQ